MKDSKRLDLTGKPMNQCALCGDYHVPTYTCNAVHKMGLTWRDVNMLTGEITSSVDDVNKSADAVNTPAGLSVLDDPASKAEKRRQYRREWMKKHRQGASP